MAINFSPEAVNFLLIDYKGEGMSGLFSELPHISGGISNLSDGQAYRAMISIKSENKRRQKIFKQWKVNNINDYTKLFIAGATSEAIPHLLIVIDEFAELKKAEPFILYWQHKNREELLMIKYGAIHDFVSVLKYRKERIVWICFITWMPARLHKQEEDTCR